MAERAFSVRLLLNWWGKASVIVTVSQKRQAVIPAKSRAVLGISAGKRLEVFEDGWHMRLLVLGSIRPCLRHEA